MPDPADKIGKLYAVDVEPVKKLKAPVTLAAVKADRRFADVSAHARAAPVGDAGPGGGVGLDPEDEPGLTGSGSGLNSRNPSGGSVRRSDWANPCDGIGSAYDGTIVADVAAAVDRGVAVQHFDRSVPRAARRARSRGAAPA